MAPAPLVGERALADAAGCVRRLEAGPGADEPVPGGVGDDLALAKPSAPADLADLVAPAPARADLPGRPRPRRAGGPPWPPPLGGRAPPGQRRACCVRSLEAGPGPDEPVPGGVGDDLALAKPSAPADLADLVAPAPARPPTSPAALAPAEVAAPSVAPAPLVGERALASAEPAPYAVSTPGRAGEPVPRGVADDLALAKPSAPPDLADLVALPPRRADPPAALAPAEVAAPSVAPAPLVGERALASEEPAAYAVLEAGPGRARR